MWIQVVREFLGSEREDVAEAFLTSLEDPAGFDVDPAISELETLAVIAELDYVDVILWARLMASCVPCTTVLYVKEEM
jgi:hypothetical protein